MPKYLYLYMLFACWTYWYIKELYGTGAGDCINTQPFVYFTPPLLQYLSSFIVVFTSLQKGQDRREEDRTLGKWREEKHTTGGPRGSAKTDTIRPVSCAENGKSQPVDEREQRTALCRLRREGWGKEGSSQDWVLFTAELARMVLL